MKKLLLALLLAVSFTASAGTITKYEAAATYTFTVPTDVYSATIYACSGSSGGGRSPFTGTYGGGGGLKQAFATLAVVPAEDCTVIVGDKGIGGTSATQDGTAGGESSFVCSGAHRASIATGTPTGGKSGAHGGAAGLDYGTAGATLIGGVGGQIFNCNSGGDAGSTSSNGQDGGVGKVWIYY